MGVFQTEVTTGAKEPGRKNFDEIEKLGHTKKSKIHE